MNSELALFRDTVRKFLSVECPISTTRKLETDPAGFDRSCWGAMSELGWMSLLVDEEYGGAGLGEDGLLYLSHIARDMGRLVVPGPLLSHSIVASAVSRSGTDSLKESILPGLASGEYIGAWCFAEALGGFDPEQITLTAENVADGFRFCGTKTFVEAGADADYFLVTARRGGQLVQAVIPASAPGITVNRLDGLDLVRRYAKVSFDNVHTDLSNIVGDEETTAQDVEQQIRLALALQCTESSGAVDRVLEFTLEWMFDRFSFGRSLASYQALKHRYADLKTWAEACSATSSSAVEAIASGNPQATFCAWVAKAYLNNRAPEIVQDCVQLHGGIGVTWDHDLHRYLRRVSANQQMFGGNREALEAVARFAVPNEGEQ